MKGSLWFGFVLVLSLAGASARADDKPVEDTQNYRKYETDWPERWEFQLAFRLVGHLWNAQRDGRALTRLQDLIKGITTASR